MFSVRFQAAGRNIKTTLLTMGKGMTAHHKLFTVLSVVYIVGVCIFMLSHRIWFSPDQFFIFALLGALFMGRTLVFIADWGPFLSLFFGYEFLRGLVPLISGKVHILPMIRFDQWLFGFVPTVAFQNWLYNPAHLHWYDYVAVVLYISHFVTPMLVGYIFWLKDRKFFHDYSLGIIVLSYAAFLTYIAFPAMPPWMASEQGFIAPIREVTGVVMSHFMPANFSLPSIYNFMRANPVAAVPSLHAGMPTVIFLFILKRFKKWGLLFAPYVLGVWFAVMYLGEHYFMDVLLGALYACLAFAVVNHKRFIWGQIRRGLTVLRSGMGKLAYQLVDSR